MIVIGALMEKSVATLFAAGLVPGLLIGAGLFVMGATIAKIQHVAPKASARWSTRGISFIRAFPIILLPLVILGGIYTGQFTPTEAASVSCIYAVIVGLFIYRGLNWKGIKSSFEFAVSNSVMIYAIMIGVSLFSFVVSRSGLAVDITRFTLSLGLSGLGVVIVLNVIMLGLGFFINPITLMYMALPVIAPVCEALDINLIWLGVLWLINSLIGAITPPMAAALYVAARVADMEPTRLFKGTLPFLGVWVLVMFAVIFIPDLALWFPRLLGLRM
jgi:C4-dicarboxylate transporter DctM subunit